MGADLWLLYLVSQTIITSSLGFSLPLSDLAGKVTPVKPKPLSPSTISSLTSRDSATKLFSSSSGGSGSCKFSAPLKLTSSSRPAPTPKLDTSSILDGKLQERLSKTLLPPKVRSLPLITKLCNDPITEYSRTNVLMPEISFPFRYPYVTSPSELPNALPTFSTPDVYLASSNKLLSLPSIQSLPPGPLESFRRSSTDALDGIFKNADVSSSTASQSLPRLKSNVNSCPVTSTLDPPILRAAKSLSSKLSSSTYSSNGLYPLTSLYSLPYPLHYKSMYLPRVRTPTDMEICNYESSACTGVNLNFPSQSNSQNIIHPPFISPATKFNSAYLNPYKTGEFPKILNTVPIPQLPPSAPSSANPVPRFNSQIINPWEKVESGPCTASIAYESKIVSPPLSPLATLDIKTFESFTTLPCIVANKLSNFAIPDLIPTNYGFMDPGNLQPRIDLENIPQYVSNNPLISPPLVQPVTCILPGTSSPVTYYPPRVSQIPATSISYINMSPPSSLSQSKSNLFPTLNGFLGQNIVSSYTPCLNSAPKCTPTSNPYANYEFKPEPLFPIKNPLPPVNLLNSESTLPIIFSSFDCTYTPLTDPSTVLTLEAPITTTSSICESLSSLSPISLPQPIITTVLPPTSLISYASPQLCPSYLPSPTLPSYPPVYMEMPYLKVRSANKKKKDMENLMELMLLTEILNEDESFDWDDLDTLLALLAIT